MHFLERRRNLQAERSIGVLSMLCRRTGDPKWEKVAATPTEQLEEVDASMLIQEPEEGFAFADLPAAAAKARNYGTWKKGFANQLYHKCR